MVNSGEMRRNEVAVQPPEPSAAGLVFIGVIRTPWTSPRDCPHGGREDGPVCRIEVSEPWVPALDGIEDFERIEVLYWLHQARRDLVRQSPGNDGKTRGAFGLSPCNPSNSPPGWGADSGRSAADSSSPASCANSEASER